MAPAQRIHETVSGREEMSGDGPDLVPLRPPGARDTFTLRRSRRPRA